MVEETQYLFFSNSLGPQNCCGLAPPLLTTCSDSGYGCPFGCKGKKGCGTVECETKPRLDGTHPKLFIRFKCKFDSENNKGRSWDVLLSL